MSEKLTGKIRFINAEKGFGFVSPGPKAGQFYFRLTSLASPEDISFDGVGTEVEFTLGPDPKHEGKQIATNLTILRPGGSADLRRQLVAFFEQRVKDAEPLHLDVNKTYLGKIIRINTEGRFGFIKLHQGGTLFFHMSALDLPLNDNGSALGTGVEVRPGPSRRNPGAYDAVQVTITDNTGDPKLLAALSVLVSSKRRSDLDAYNRRAPREDRSADLAG